MQKSFAILAMVWACFPPAVAALPFLTGSDDEIWISEAFGEVLTKTSMSHCSLIFFLDSPSSDIYEATRLHIASTRISGDVVFEVTDEVGLNTTMKQVVAQARKMRLMSWCALVVVFSDNPTFLSVFAEMADEGRLMVWETKLLVITRIPLSSLEDLMQNYWTFSMMNTMFMKIKETAGINQCQLYGNMPYSPSGPQLVRLASLRPGHLLVFLKNRTLFPEKYENFNGMKVNISWLPLTPYWMEEKRPGPNGTEVRTYTGREYRIMENIGSILNFSLNPLPFIGAEAVRKRLITREAFLWPVNLPVLPHMLDLFDISFFLEPSTLAFSMVKPSMKATWQSLYYPLRIEVWVLVLATVIIVYIVLMLMNRSGKDKGPDPWSVMKQVLGTLLDEAIPGQLPLRSTTRVVLTAWLLFSFIVGTVYRSNLTASLTVVKDPPRIKSFSGLVDAGTKILVVDIMDMFYDNFKQSRSEVLRTIAARMEMVPDHKDGLTRCLTENAAYLFEGLFIEVMIAEDFTDKWQSTPLYVTRNNLLADFTAFLLIRDAPFKPNFDYCLITFQGAGLIGKWKTDMMDQIRRERRQKQSNSTAVEVQETMKPLTLVHMQGPLFLYLACVIASSFAFFTETSFGVCLH